MARIVGYFSRIANWNKSKLGELRDRHRGNYAVTPVCPPAPSACAARTELGTAAG
jgi:ribonucleoside-triphosphate reductase